MSSSTIARWNAISMAREPKPIASLNKRSRSETEHGDDDSSEDNVSLVSRSPSPAPQGDVEMKDANMYDKYVRGVAREVITVETRIKSSNKGFAMLAKMGWSEGKPLGISGEGRIDPIPFTVKQDSTGLGKITQDVRMIETTVSQRRNLDSERMQHETEEQRQQREASVAQKAAVQSEISTVLRPFYCELCDKQFKNVAQYDEHTNSYAHHHKARTKDMNANHPMKVGGKEEAEKRKEKERKREEKELRKMAKAAGIKMTAPPAVAGFAQPPSGESKSSARPGWAAVSSTPASSSSSPSASGGWASAAAPPPSSGSWAAVSSPAPPSVPRTSGWQAVPPSSAPPPPPSAPAASSSGTSFRSGGWSTLSTSPGELSGPPPGSDNRNQRRGWAGVGAPTGPPPPAPPSNPVPPPSPAPHAAPPPSGPFPSSSWSRFPTPTSNPASAAPPPVPPSMAPLPPPPNVGGRNSGMQASRAPEQDKREGRGGWQSFQKMRGRR
ncbi:hypothetical protein M0805_003403 [Coniferiporia weirii]|nr:hypothetical protein M0805_003403 [Coniferiporia weirii]